MRPLLSVIVPTVPGREEALSRSLFYLGGWDGAEIIVIDGAGGMGDKICEGLEDARGGWSVVVDDDDIVTQGFLGIMVAELGIRGPDAIGYRMLITVDGAFARVVNMRQGGHLPPWQDLEAGVDWCLLPKCVFRTEHGRAVGFGNHYTADQDFAIGLAELVGRAAFIPQLMYHYDKRTRHDFGGPVTGYGLWPAP